MVALLVLQQQALLVPLVAGGGGGGRVAEVRGRRRRGTVALPAAAGSGRLAVQRWAANIGDTN